MYKLLQEKFVVYFKGINWIFILFPGIRFIKGNFVFGALNKFLGVNNENVEAYSQENVKMLETWTAEQIEIDSTETAFARITFDNKISRGICNWLFQIIHPNIYIHLLPG